MARIGEKAVPIEENSRNLPPNYRGMLDMTDNPVVAEGIDRLVGEDESYINYRKKIEENCAKREQSKANEGEKGLHKLIGGLSDGSFQAEDVLIAAMIILMLNSTSEDDILMVLVLMMLL